MTRQMLAQIAAATAVLLVSGASLAATPTVKRSDVPPSGLAVKTATVLGNAWKADNTPLPQARVRLRDVTTGRVLATAVANDAGQFTFANIEDGTFAVELVNEHGKVLAISEVFSLAPGETIATFVRLASRGSLLSGFFSNAATTAVTAASSLGLTALGSNGQPVSAAPGSGQ